MTSKSESTHWQRHWETWFFTFALVVATLIWLGWRLWGAGFTLCLPQGTVTGCLPTAPMNGVRE